MIGMTNASLSSVDTLGPKITTAKQVIINVNDFADAEGRTGSAAVTPPFTQTISFASGSTHADAFLAELTSSSTPIISMYMTLDPSTSTTSEIKKYEKDYGSITKIDTGGTAGSSNGSITVYCYYRKPTQDVTVTIKGVL